MIAVLILIVAGINFMNLATARSAKRAREVGVRKVLGAGRKQLSIQFLGESVVFGLIAFVGAVLLIELAMPLFNSLTDKNFTGAIWAKPAVMVGLLSVSMLLGLASGLYPAMIISRFRPVQSLKGLFHFEAEVALETCLWWPNSRWQSCSSFRR